MSDAGQMDRSVWGDEETKHFLELTPDKVLDAVEAANIITTGRCFQLNSMENRVYDVEIELEDELAVKTQSDRFRIVKFYRPGRWSKGQILQEHEFLNDLITNEIPAIALAELLPLQTKALQLYRSLQPQFYICSLNPLG